jgi:hypothetical protein
MSRLFVFLVCALLAVTALATTSVVGPSPALAASGTLQFDTSLQADPRDDANSLSWLAAGTEAYVTGDSVDGYYPVTVGVLTGWIRADALVLEEEIVTTAIVVGVATPVGAVAAPEAIPVEATAPEPPLDPNAPSVTVPDPGPIGPAAVMADVAIYAGPGSDYGVLGTAGVGQLVEQTGHAVGGYVTVRYVDVTGWVPLDHLGPAPAITNG